MATTTESVLAATLAASSQGQQDERWSDGAPLVLRRYLQTGDSPGWKAWARHLAKRKLAKPIGKLLASAKRTLAWGLCPATTGHVTTDWIRTLSKLAASASRAPKSLAEEVADWLGDADLRPRDSAAALETLAACYALPNLAAHLSEELWWKLCDHLLSEANDIRQTSSACDPSFDQILAGELPLALYVLFPELTACCVLGDAAQVSITRSLNETVTPSGLPPRVLGSSYPLLLASWVRSKVLSSAKDELAWDETANQRLEQAVRTAVAMSLPEGGMLLSGEPAAAVSPGFVRDAAKLLDVECRDRKRVKSKESDAEPPAESLRPLPSVHSEEQQIAVLRPSWRKASPRLAVDFRSSQVQTELAIESSVVWSGQWSLDLRRDGAPLAVESPWEELCWISDDDVDYLEIQTTLTGDVRLQRQMLLARYEGVLFLADAIVSKERGRFDYTTTLPLTTAATFVPAEETREGTLNTDRALAGVLPLALGEWRTDVRRGSLQAGPRGLQLQLQAEGERMYAPLFVDLDPRRRKHELTWRQLTVANKRQIEPADVAVGYRVQIGQRQWLIYRSLTEPAVRTVLGQNLSTEFLFGRVRKTGDVDRLLEIE